MGVGWGERWRERGIQWAPHMSSASVINVTECQNNQTYKELQQCDLIGANVEDLQLTTWPTSRSQHVVM